MKNGGFAFLHSSFFVSFHLYIFLRGKKIAVYWFFVAEDT